MIAEGGWSPDARTTPRRPKDLVKAVGDSGLRIDPLNDKRVKGKVGTLLDLVSLDRKLRSGK